MHHFTLQLLQDPDDIIFIGASHQSLAIQDSDESDESNDFGNDFEDNTSIFSLNFDEVIAIVLFFDKIP